MSHVSIHYLYCLPLLVLRRLTWANLQYSCSERCGPPLCLFVLPQVTSWSQTCLEIPKQIIFNNMYIYIYIYM